MSNSLSTVVTQAATSTNRSARRPVRRRARMSSAEAAKRLHELTVTADLTPQMVQTVVTEIAAGLTGALGVAYLARNADGRICLQEDRYYPPHLSHLRSLLQHMAKVGNAAAAECSPQAVRAGSDSELLVVAVPVLGVATTGDTNEAIAIAISIQDPRQAKSSTAFLTQVLTWISAFLESMQRSHPRSSGGATPATRVSIQDVCALSASQPNLTAGSKCFANWVQDTTGSQLVIIGMRRGWRDECRVIACSGDRKFDDDAHDVRVINDLVEETLLATDDGVLDESLLATTTTQEVARKIGLNVDARYPLFDQHDRPYGAVIGLSTADAGHRATTPKKVLPPESIKTMGEQLFLLKAATPQPLQRLLGLHQTGKPWYRHPAVIPALLSICLLLLVPLPLKVRCDCQIQPRLRRFICVPYEGRLDGAFTEPGELVEQGQLLAKMDGRDIEFEISGLVAELHKAEKQRDSAMAAFDTSATQMAAFETERLQLQINVLRQRLANLEIRSPVRGFVMGGDPRKLEGARLTLGETLMEVAPLDQLIVELKIPDEDIAHVEEQQPVSYRLAASPWSSREGQIELIHPRAEIRDQANVFVAEVAVDNHDGTIRPGMRGKAKVTAAWHPLGWNLFHKAWDSLWAWAAW